MGGATPMLAAVMNGAEIRIGIANALFYDPGRGHGESAAAVHYAL